MKKPILLILLMLSVMLAFAAGEIESNNDTLYYEHRMKLPTISPSLKIMYVDSLLAYKNAGRDSLLAYKVDLAFGLGKYNAVIESYEELLEKYPKRESLSDELKLQLDYIYGLYSKRQFYECIMQCADLLNKTKPDSLRYYNSLVECLLVDFNHQTSVPYFREYIDRNETLLRNAIKKRFPKNSIDNIRYALFTIKMKDAMRREDFNVALSYLDSMTSIPLSNNRKEAIATNMAYTYMRLGKFDVAEECFKGILESDQSNERKAVSLLNYTHMLNLQGRYSETLMNLDKYKEVGESLDKELYGAYLLGNRAIAENSLGRHEEAYNTLMRSKTMSDSIYYNSGIQDGLLMLFDQNSKAKALGDLEKELRFSRRWLVAISFIALVMIFIAAWFWHSVRKQERAKMMIEANLEETKTRCEEIERSYTEIIQEGSGKVAAQLLPLAHNEEVIGRLETILRDGSVDAEEKVRLMGEALSSANMASGSREMFERHFEQAHSEFFRRLYAAYPSLSPVEVRMCAFLVMNLSNKEIAAMVNKSVRSVESTRYRISKKLDIPDGESIISHLRQFLVG